MQEHVNTLPMVITLLMTMLLFVRPQMPAFALAFVDKLMEPDKPKERPAWEELMMFKKGGSSAPAPDPRIGEAALKQAELGEKWYQFAGEQFKVANERQAAQDVIANEVTQNQLSASKEARQWAQEDRARYQNTFKPLQDEFIETAKNWDSEGRQQKVADEARADVLNNAATQRMSTMRSQAAMGIDPTSGRYAGVDRAGEQATALAAAGAQNQARNTVRNQALALKSDAVNMGNGLAVNPGSSLGLSTQAGSAAMQTTAGNNAQSAGNSSIVGQGISGAMSGYGNMGSMLNQQYGNQLNAWQIEQQNKANSAGSLWGGLGSLVGMGVSMFSSKEYKEDKKPMAEGVGLDAIRKMPVESWKYKDGVADGGEHVGVYAEDFQKATGKGDGKSIPVVDAIGVTMKAVQDLDRKVTALSKGMGLPKHMMEAA